MLTWGFHSIDPHCVIVVRDRLSGRELFVCDWGRELILAEEDQARLIDEAATMPREEFLERHKEDL
jgi:hypothetical protein